MVALDLDLRTQEVEDQLVTLLERGATVESDVLANVKTMLPAEAVTILDEFIPEPPNKQAAAAAASASASASWSEPMATGAPAPVVTYSQGDVMTAQVGRI